MITTSNDNQLIDEFVKVGMEIDVQETSTTTKPALSMNVTPRHDTIGLQAERKSTEFCATVTAQSLPEDDDSARAPVDIVVVLDVSGSMQGRKLDLCKDTVELLLRELSPRDRFGLVTFGNEAQLVIPMRELTKQNKEAAALKVRSLHTSGCTNMSGGIGMAAQELDAVETPHEVRTIFLLTDGHANRGISDRAGIVELTKNCLGPTSEKKEVAIHCFGYGVDHDQEMLGDIGNATEGGSYYFVDKDSDISSAFGDALGGILSVVAQNTVVEIKSAADGVSILNVHHDKAVKQLDGSYKVSIGDFYAEETRDVLITTTLQEESTNTHDHTCPHIEVSISYLDTIHKKLVSSSPPLLGTIQRPNGDLVSKPNTHVVLQSIRIDTTKVITNAGALAEANDLAGARSAIEAQVATIQKETAENEAATNPLSLQFLSELNSILPGLSTKNEWKAKGSKKAKMTTNSWNYQRCYAANFDNMSVEEEEGIETMSVPASTFQTSSKMKRAMRMKAMSKK